MAAGCHNPCHPAQGNWRQPALPNSLVLWQSRAPDPSDSRMGKGEAGDLCALPRALRMTLLFIYSTWDHWAWAVVFPILLENIHHHLIWLQHTEFCFIQYISQKASVKATLRVKCFRVRAVPAQTCELQLNQRVRFHGDHSDGCTKEGSRPFWFYITKFFLGAFASSAYAKKNTNYSKMTLQMQKSNDPLNKLRLLWCRWKTLMPKGGILCSGGQLCLSGLSHSSPTKQRAQGWLRLAITSVVDFEKTWKHFHSTCMQTGIRGMSPRQQNYSLELAWSI